MEKIVIWLPRNSSDPTSEQRGLRSALRLEAEWLSQHENSSLLRIWYLRCLRASKVHYKTAHLMRWYDIIITLINIIASISVLCIGSAYWAGIDSNHALTIAFGLAGVAVVIRAIIQYVFDFKTQMLEHRQAAADYACVRREIEEIISKPHSAADITNIKKKIDDLGRLALIVPGRIWSSENNLSTDIDTLQTRVFERAPPTEVTLHN